ncbi:MAG: hypothetical protein ACTHN3_12675 [Solirubrobacterales bacterium]
MSKGKFFAVLAALAAMLLLAVGCGGGGDSSLTRAEFVKQGNAICKEGEKERGKMIEGALKLVKPGEEATTADQEKVVQTALVGPYRKMAKKLEGLEAPQGDEETIESLIKAMEEAAQKAEDKPLANLHSDSQFAEANKIAAKYGLNSCVV